MIDDSTHGGILRSERGSIGSGRVDGTMRQPISASIGPMPGQSKRGLTISPKSGRPVVGETSGTAPMLVPVCTTRSTRDPSYCCSTVASTRERMGRFRSMKWPASLAACDSGSRGCAPRIRVVAGMRTVPESVVSKHGPCAPSADTRGARRIRRARLRVADRAVTGFRSTEGTRGSVRRNRQRIPA